MSMDVPFPLSRRKAFVLRHAKIINGMSPASAERHVVHQLKVQRNALERRGVDPDRIDRELDRLSGPSSRQASGRCR
jgi:Family of unknown function (DUF6074)